MHIHSRDRCKTKVPKSVKAGTCMYMERHEICFDRKKRMWVIVPVSAVPLINRCRAYRTLLQDGCHITCGAWDIVIGHHRRPHWLKSSVGGVSPVRRDSSLSTLRKPDQTITSLEDINICYFAWVNDCYSQIACSGQSFTKQVNSHQQQVLREGEIPYRNFQVLHQHK